VIAALQTHAKGRALLLSAAALAAVLSRIRVEAPPPRTVEGVASALGAAAGGSVKPDDFLWEGRGGFLHDAFVGRQVMFLVSAAPGAPRDLYRARVRLTRAGRPISVSDVRDLSRTPLGDDRDLTGSGHHVAFVTSTPDGVQGVTLLDLDGPGAALGPWSARARAAIEGWVATGSTRGLGRVEVAFAQAPTEAKIEVGDDALVMALGAEGTPAALDFTTGALQVGRAGGVPSGAFGATAQRISAPERPAGEVAADFVGAAFGEGLGSVARALFARAPRLSPRPPNAAPEGLRISANYPAEGGWPPAPIAPPSQMPFDGEGFWHVAVPMQGPGQEVAAPPLLEAIVRPDPARPGAIVHLIAIDARRLDVRIVPGTASPAPAAGPRGSGLLPRGKEVEGVVAAFVAGPVPAARSFGFAGEGRLFAPLVAGAPSLAARPDGRGVLGAWPESASRDAFVSVAQGPDAMGGAAAFAPANAAAPTSRAALCRTGAGYLIYAFAVESSADSLRAALKLAGCASAMHLGAEPSPLGFAYVHAQGDALTATLASGTMSMPVDHVAGPWDEQIGVLVQRDLAPASGGKKVAWAVDAGAQPAPAWLPGVFSFETEQQGAKVKVTAFMPERATFRIAVGSDEGVGGRGAKPGPPAAERTAALVALGMSVSKRGARRGLVVGGAELMKPSSGAVWLAFDGAHVSISRPGDPAPASGDATEVPLVADDHKILPAAREVGTQRPRSAMCALADGTVIVAHSTFDTDEAGAEALLDAGCDRVVALDRGAHDGVFVHRAGGERVPEATYEATAIYVVPGAGSGTVKDF